MRIQLTEARREEGAVAVMTALLVVVLIGVAAFTTDFGMAYAQRQALATGADSAALGVARAMNTSELNNPTGSCAALRDQYSVVVNGSTKASDIALTQVNANAPFGATIASTDVSTTLVCLPPQEQGPLQVTVTVNRTIDPILAGVLGGGPMNVNRTAVAAVGVANGVTIAPITMCTHEADAITAQHVLDVNKENPDSAQLVPLDKVWNTGTSCDGGGGSGNWGWLDFGHGVSVPDLVNYINGTYTKTITLDASGSFWMDGAPGDKGNSNNVATALQDYLMDKTVAIPVYTSVTGNGSNTKYNVSGFLSVKLCGYMANSKDAKGTCYDGVTPAVQLAKDTLQVRYSGYTPISQIGTWCFIGQPCAYNAYVTKLLR